MDRVGTHFTQIYTIKGPACSIFAEMTAGQMDKWVDGWMDDLIIYWQALHNKKNTMILLAIQVTYTYLPLLQQN